MSKLPHRLLLVAGIAALAGHVGWWYWPRLHRGVPRGAPAALLAAPGLDDAVWIAYPHQNLARLESHAGRIDALAGQVATLLEGEPPAWPRFVFWPVPPARALAWARSADGAHELVAIEPYPVIGWLLRAAGALADNPWLAGGAVGDGEGAGQVHWQDGTWILERGNVPLSHILNVPEHMQAERLREAAGKQGAAQPRALAWMRIGGGHPPWPAGLYRLRVLPGGVELATGGGEASAAGEAVRRLRRRSVLIAVAARGDGAGAVAFVRPQPSRTELRLPGAVLVQRGDSGLELPGARLLEAIGVEPHERAAGAFRILSWDRGSLALGSELAQGLRPADRAGDLPRLAVWTDLDEVAAWTEALGGALQVVPFIDPEPARRWLAFAALARAPGPSASLWAEIDRSGRAARIVLRHEPGTVD